MKLVFIVNEQAGSGKGASVWKRYCSKLTLQHIVHHTRYAKHATKLAKSYIHRVEEQYLIVAVGGDGTVHEVIEGAAGCEHISIGVLKAGSGNDFARGYTVFHSIEEIQSYVEHNDAKDTALRMDLGRMTIGGQRTSFVNNAGIGFDAYITSTVNTSRIKRWLNVVKLGGLTYLIVTIWALFRFKPFQVTVHHEKQSYSFDKVWFVAVCNQPYFGGGMKISPKSVASDELLELTVVHNLSRLKLLMVFLTVFWGRHEQFKEVTMLQGRRFQVHVDASTVGHVDGEGLGLIREKDSIVCDIDDRKWRLASNAS